MIFDASLEIVAARGSDGSVGVRVYSGGWSRGCGERESGRYGEERSEGLETELHCDNFDGSDAGEGYWRWSVMLEDA